MTASIGSANLQLNNAICLQHAFRGPIGSQLLLLVGDDISSSSPMPATSRASGAWNQ
jgi:hypothetical protein